MFVEADCGDVSYAIAYTLLKEDKQYFTPQTSGLEGYCLGDSGGREKHCRTHISGRISPFEVLWNLCSIVAGFTGDRWMLWLRRRGQI